MLSLVDGGADANDEGQTWGALSENRVSGGASQKADAGLRNDPENMKRVW